jgi:transcriptional regulator with XRE-family HTH domain
MVVSPAVRHLPPSPDRLPWLLPELRARAGLTQQQLADRMGASLPTVQRLEAGAHPATMKRTWQLADALGVSAAELVALVDAAGELGDRGEVAGWLDRLSWLPNPSGPLQRPSLVDEGGRALSLPAGTLLGADAETQPVLLRRSRVFGLLLRQLRARVHLPLADLASLWGPSASTIKRFEGGKSTPDLLELGALASLLGLNRVELVALAEELCERLPREVPRRRRTELVDTVRGWLESLRWRPNPGEGLLASRPAGYRWRLVEVAGVRSGDAAPDAVLSAGPEEQDEDLGSQRAVLWDELVRPAAQALAEPLLRGWSVVGAALPPVPVEKKSLTAVVAGELIRVLDGMGWRAWPALLVRPGVRGRGRSSGMGTRPPRLSTVAPADAQLELLRGGPLGPWRLVVVEGLETLDAAGLGRRQPAPQLQGAALAVLQTDPTQRTEGLSQLLGRRVDFASSAVAAMDAGLLPGVRYHGVRDPTPQTGQPRFGGMELPDRAELCDDRRLDALAEAGAFAAGRCTLLHLADGQEEAWARSWLERRLEDRADQVLVALRSSAKLRFKRPVDEVVLAAAGYPATLVRQVFAALRRADIEAGLDVWTLQLRGLDEQKRRGALAAALGARSKGSPPWSGTSWRSPKGRCTFEWAGSRAAR